MIRSLRIFCDLVETRNFTETGRRNYLTQSAVSQHLKALEQKFGRRLLERTHRQIGLTPPGRLVYEAGQEILKRYAKLEAELRRPPREVSGTLRIAATLTVGLYELSALMPEFIKRHPKIDLQVSYLKAAEVYEALLTGRQDLGVLADPEPHPQLHAALFKKDEFIIIVPRGHAWAAFKRVSITRLEGQPFITMQAGLLTRRVIDRLLRACGIKVNVVYAFDNLELIKRAVEVGAGVALVPRDTVRSEVDAGTLVALRITEGPFDYPMKILTRKYAEPSGPTHKFVEFLAASQRGAGAAPVALTGRKPGGTIRRKR